MKILRVKEDVEKGGLQPPQKLGDVGHDLIVSEDTLLKAKQDTPIDIPCGICVKLPRGTWGLIIGRSGAIRKSGLIIMPGVIDEGYTGPLYACCLNRTDDNIMIRAGIKLAQLIIMPSMPIDVRFVTELPKTKRGADGFGSTDKS